MLIKIAIFTVIGLLGATLFGLRRFWGKKLHRALLKRELAKIGDIREHLLRLQRILELPDAYERLLIEGVIVYRVLGQFRFIVSPGARQVRSFIEANRVDPADRRNTCRLSYLLEELQDKEDHVRAALYVIAARDKPANRDPHLIEQRSKIEQLEHQLAAERKQLEKLEAQDRSPDPYGRIPKMRLERYVPMDAAEPKEAPHSRKKRA